jgi:hypothetical protein
MTVIRTLIRFALNGARGKLVVCLGIRATLCRR